MYIDAAAQGQGAGLALYTALLPAVCAASFHSIIGGIAIPNPASIALHESFGFEHDGTLHEVGMKFGRRWDVGYWELLSNSSAG